MVAMPNKIHLAKYSKMLPRPLNVLVRNVRGTADYAFSAMCLQYPVEGRAKSEKEATISLLVNLSLYLSDCDRLGAKPFAAVHDQDQELFYNGESLRIDVADISKFDVRIRFVRRDEELPLGEEASSDVLVDLRETEAVATV
jgi:hypothetical protein